ncbi:hypothetical protein CU098_008746 [Rhizopus stolonifer]|uniref:Uncharacterized protein n=1 Tax=Rhizopus stolonifer TaxID=4846 RepID=A0A367K7L7_RHIST|nr:hypothetical protein CU098_008746 [Rhizopus stolonifer]
MSMFWMPKLQETFNVIPALACNGITQPYWEENFVYPTDNSDAPTTKTTTAGAKTTTTTTAASTPTSSTCTSGSYGLGNGDGYNGACCQDQSDCQDDCISGKCNGPKNPNSPTTTKAATKTKTTKASTKTTKATKKSSPTSSSCIAGVAGKKKGNGKNGYCCTSSNDCLETCRKGKCSL